MFVDNGLKNLGLTKQLDEMACYAFIKNEQRQYTYANDAVCALFGVPREEILGKTDEHFFDLEKSNQLKENDVSVLGGTSTCVVEHNVVDGDRRSYQVIKAPIKSNDGMDSVIGLLGLAIDITESVEASERLKYLSDHDDCTKLFNKKYFLERLESEFSLHRRHNQAFSVIIFDADYFKKINDTYGHVAGDEVLKIVGKVLTEELRIEDIASRFGGDEFAIILPFTPLRKAFDVAERLRTIIENKKVVVDGQKIDLTITLGVVDSTLAVAEPISLLDSADQALIFAKKQARNQVLAKCKVNEEFMSCHTCKYAADGCV